MKLPFFSKAIKPDPEGAPPQPDILYLNTGGAVAVITNAEAVAVEQALRHPIIYRAVNKLAESVQQVKWFAEVDPEARRVDQSGKESFIKDLQQLLDNPNTDMTAEQLRYWLGLNWALYGRVPFKVGYSATNAERANGIYPLEARKVYAKQNIRGQIDRYEYGTGEGKTTYVSKVVWERNKNVEGFAHQIWKPGLKGYQNRDDITTPLSAIWLPAEVVRLLLIRSIQTARGQPNVRYLVTCSKTLTIAQKAALKNYLEDHGTEGAEAGNVPVLQNAGDVEIHKLDNDLSDIHSKMPSDDMARLIFGAYGIPVAIAGIGAADAAKFASNYIESRQAFWQDTVVPAHITPLFQGLSQALCPPGVRISPDLDSIPALMPARITAMKDINEIVFLTTDEKRALFGWGETDLLPALTTTTTSPLATEGVGVTKPKPAAEPKPTEGEPTDV